MSMVSAYKGNDNLKHKNSTDKIGLFLFCFYIFVNFLANDVILPSSIGSISLYLFLGYSVLYIILRKKLKLCSIVGWMAAFMGYSLITMFYSPEKNIFGGTFYTLIVNIVLVLLLSQYTITLKVVERIGWTYAFSAATLVFFLIVTGNIIDASVSGRLGTELLGNANILATMLMTAAIYTIWLLTYSNLTKLHRNVLILFLIAEYFGMFLSGGRKYIVVPMVFFYILLLFKQDARGQKHIVKYTIMIIVLLLFVWILVMNVPIFYNIIGVRIEEFFDLLSGNQNNQDYSSQIRLEMIQAGLAQWLESPIWGYGFDSFKYFNRTLTGHFYYSHNNFVELLYNLGIIGFVIYYWFFWKLVYVAWKGKIRYTPEVRAYVIGLVLSMLVFEYGAVNYTGTASRIMFFFAYTMLVQSSSERGKIDGQIKDGSCSYDEKGKQKSVSEGDCG